MPVDIFFSYSHEDEQLMNDVRRQLVIYEREGKINKWHDRQIPPGTQWETQIDQRLRNSHIILLFVSPAFLESRYCYDIEVVAALERHMQGKARVIPIILRPCAWENSPFANLQALPKDGRPVTQWPDRDQVCLDIARSVISVVDDLINGVSPTIPTLDTTPERRYYEGDRIPRIIVPFAPPTGINIPKGYQIHLNRISADLAIDNAVRGQNGRYKYPVQLKGSVKAIQEFIKKPKLSIGIQNIGIDETESPAQLWFEYEGDLSPKEVSAYALTSNLNVVHCGATLLGSVSSTKPS